VFFGAQPIFIRKLNEAQQQFLKIWFCTFAKGTWPFQIVKMFGYEG
jgi:hypothetical protein